MWLNSGSNGFRAGGFLCLMIASVSMMAGEGRADGEEDGSRLSIHGYGELHYNNPKTGSSVPKDGDPAAMDMHRMVWGLSYHWTDRINLHAEVDFEHGAQEMELEYAYLDFLIDPRFNARAGSVLMPVGPLNEYHEPTLFYSVERPFVQNAIIPTTWQEGGAGLFGAIVPGLRYRAYVVSGLNAEGFSASGGIRGGRGKVAGGSGSVKKVPPISGEELAYVARLEYVGLPGLAFGASGYTGGANQTNSDFLKDVRVNLAEADVRYRIGGLELQGLYTQIRVKEAEKITKEDCELAVLPPGGEVDEVCTSSSAKIGEKMIGWYAEAAYHVLRLVLPDTEHDLVVFARWERFNTQKEVPSNYTASPENDRRVLTYGLAYFPHRDVAIKVDQERWKNEADEKNERLNVGIAYMF